MAISVFPASAAASIPVTSAPSGIPAGLTLRDTITSSTTLSYPASVTQFYVIAIGAGGAGGPPGSGGGGGGGALLPTITLPLLLPLLL